MTIDKSLKEKFIKFCETKNGGKIFVSNLMKKGYEWFYVQVGKFFDDYLHIEYTDLDGIQRLQFHIEFDTIAESQGFYDLLEKLEPSITQYLTPVQNMKKYTKQMNYLWFDINNTTNIATEKDLFNEFTTYIKKLNSAIRKIEKLYHK